LPPVQSGLVIAFSGSARLIQKVILIISYKRQRITLITKSDQIGVNRTKSEIPSNKSGPYCKVPAVACGPSHTHPLWTKVIGPHIGPNRRHPLPNLHHFLTYLYKTFHPALFGSNLSWHCQFVISYRPLCKLLNDAKNNLCQNLISCILSSETNRPTNNKNLHQIGLTNYLSSTVNTDLDLEMTIIILRRHCL